MKQNASVVIVGHSCVPTLAEIKKSLRSNVENRELMKSYGNSSEEIRENVTETLLYGANSIADALNEYLTEQGFDVGVIGEAVEQSIEDAGQEGCTEIVLELFTNSSDAEKVAGIAIDWLVGQSDEYFDFEMIDQECSDILLAMGWWVEECFDCWLEPNIVITE